MVDKKGRYTMFNYQQDETLNPVEWVEQRETKLFDLAGDEYDNEVQ